MVNAALGPVEENGSRSPCISRQSHRYLPIVCQVVDMSYVLFLPPGRLHGAFALNEHKRL